MGYANRDDYYKRPSSERGTETTRAITRLPYPPAPPPPVTIPCLRNTSDEIESLRARIAAPPRFAGTGYDTAPRLHRLPPPAPVPLLMGIPSHDHYDTSSPHHISRRTSPPSGYYASSQPCSNDSRRPTHSIRTHDPSRALVVVDKRSRDESGGMYYAPSTSSSRRHHHHRDTYGSSGHSESTRPRRDPHSREDSDYRRDRDDPQYGTYIDKRGKKRGPLVSAEEAGRRRDDRKKNGNAGGSKNKMAPEGLALRIAKWDEEQWDDNATVLMEGFGGKPPCYDRNGDPRRHEEWDDYAISDLE